MTGAVEVAEVVQVAKWPPRPRWEEPDPARAPVAPAEAPETPRMVEEATANPQVEAVPAGQGRVPPIHQGLGHPTPPALPNPSAARGHPTALAPSGDGWSSG